jgi:type II secretory pathway component PulF
VLKKLSNKKGLLQISLFNTISPVERILLVRNLGTSLKAGLNILESLDVMISDTDKPLMKKILTSAKNDIESGYPLSHSLQRYPRHFPPFFIGMIKAGEASGKLDVSLKELASYLNREYGLVKKVRAAMAYPMILLVSSIGIITLMIGYVLPKLRRTFEQNSYQLPWITRALLALSGLITYNWYLDILVLVILAVGLLILSRTVSGRLWAARVAFRLPLVNQLLKKIALVRLTRTLASSISSGAPLVEALQLSAESVGNETYRAAITGTVEDVSNGVNLSVALGHYSKLFPRFLTSMLVVGERSGNLEEVLVTFADFYDEEVDDSLKTVTTFLEPIMLLLMGLIIGGISLAILLPIYSFVGKFS